MFKKKTTFILGAGASWHYGYPTGEELVRMVKEVAADLIDFYSPLIEVGGPRIYPDNFGGDKFAFFFRSVREIKKRLDQANPLVIDDFLGRNRAIADVGKLLIALVLLKCEKETNIRSGKKDEITKEDTGKGDWVRYIVQNLTVDCDRPEDLLTNQVTFVTFNYDHSLELRLYQALKNYEWFSDGGCSERFFSPGRFHHVYGQLRDFAPTSSPKAQSSYGGRLGEMANTIDIAWNASLALDKAGKPRIRTIGPDEKHVAPEVAQVIADAEYLYFLGYGFDRRNNELLGLGQPLMGPSVQHVKFTNFGNHNKVSNAVATRYHADPNALAGQSYNAQGIWDRRSSVNDWVYYPCEKSIKSVYDALAEDFDWPE